MTTNQALTIVTNANAKLDAVNTKLSKGGPYVAPAEVSDIIIEPNAELRDDLSEQIAALQTNAQALAEYAANN